MDTPNEPSLVWVVGLGHSGTSAAWRVFRQLEVVTDDQSEWGPVAVTNGEILRFYYGGADHPWWRMPYHSGPLPDELGQAIRNTPLKKVVKDPRWSVTLPHWLVQDPSRVPAHVLMLDRAAEDCALSWTHDHINNGHRELYPAAVQAAEYRQEILRSSELALVQMGRTVHRLVYPEFVLDPTLLVETVATITGVEEERVRVVVAKWIKPERTHTYSYVRGRVLRVKRTSGRPQLGRPQGDAR